MPGITVGVNGQCIGCGTCTQDVCFVDAISVVEGQAVISETCRGCGRCVSVCPQEAIEMSIEYAQFVEKSIARISQLVDVA
jgi:UDP-glucose 4-epimerase